MTFRTILTATILTLVPALSYAACTYHEQQASSCAEGYVWDADAAACVEKVTG